MKRKAIIILAVLLSFLVSGVGSADSVGKYVDVKDDRATYLYVGECAYGLVGSCFLDDSKDVSCISSFNDGESFSMNLNVTTSGKYTLTLNTLGTANSFDIYVGDIIYSLNSSRNVSGSAWTDTSAVEVTLPKGQCVLKVVSKLNGANVKSVRLVPENCLFFGEKKYPLTLRSGSALTISERENTNFIYGVPEKASESDIIKNFANSNTINTSSNDGSFGTGTRLFSFKDGVLYDSAYIVIAGDTNGDGFVTGTDYLRIKRMLASKYNLNDALYVAADVDGADGVTVNDYLKLKAYFKGMLKINNEFTNENLDMTDIAEDNYKLLDGQIVISVYWPPYGDLVNDTQFRLLKEANVDLLEYNSDPIYTNSKTLSGALALSEKYGLHMTLTDESAAEKYLTMTDDELKTFVAKYSDNPSVVGFYIKDEPVNANHYSHAVRTIASEFDNCIAQLNLLPMSIMADPKGYVEDWANMSGYGVARYLSYDHYPFRSDANSIPQMFGNMKLMYETGLKYGIDTALYIQSIGNPAGFRRTSTSEIRYHMSAALAYGFKNLKFFTWETPVNRNEVFTDAIIDASGNPTDMYAGVCEINYNIKKVSSILGNVDAIEIYHSGRRDADTSLLPANYYLAPSNTSDDNLIISLMEDRDSGKNYIMVVNKDFINTKEYSFTLNGIKTLYDVTDGGCASVNLNSNEFKTDIEAGGFKLYTFDENLIREEKDEYNVNYALEKAVYTSESVGSGGYFAYKAVDGINATQGKSAWRNIASYEKAFLTVDLRKAKMINRVDVYPNGVGDYFPISFSVSVSDDNVNYTKVGEYNREGVLMEVPSIKFDTVKARFIKIEANKTVKCGGKFYCEIGEVEIYNDDGNTPNPPKLIMQNENVKNLAQGKIALVTSESSSEYGWNSNNLTDGNVATGWTSAVKKNPTDKTAPEGFTIDLINMCTVEKIVLYPANKTYFPKLLHVFSSIDGVNFTLIEIVSSAEQTTPVTIELYIAKCRYVKVVSLEMNAINSDGYLFQLGEIEIYGVPYECFSNHALNKPVTVSSESSSEYGWKSANINDGSSRTGWTSAVKRNPSNPNAEEYFVVDMQEEILIDKIILYSISINHFPNKYSVLSSLDGKTYSEIKTVSSGTQLAFATINANGIKARYIKVLALNMKSYGVDGYLFQIGEIIVTEQKNASSEVNIALKKPVKVSSEGATGWGWSSGNLTDGDVNTGWTSALSVHMDDAEAIEWAMVDLQAESKVSEVVLYASSNKIANFPKKFKVSISNDGVNFTDEVDYMLASINLANPIIIYVGKTCRYVRIQSLEMVVMNKPDGFLFQLGEIEVR